MKTLRFLFFSMVVGFLAPQVNAQGKIGYISLNELITAMPEYKKAEADIKDYQQALADQGKEYQNQLAEKDSIFKADSLKWNDATREVKRQELSDMYRKYITFNQQIQQNLNQKEQELLAPIQDKATAAVRAVATEGGYRYVLSKEQLIVGPPADDLLNLALKKLKITPPAAEGAKEAAH